MELTLQQLKVLKTIERAIKQCKKVNLEITVEKGTINYKEIEKGKNVLPFSSY